MVYGGFKNIRALFLNYVSAVTVFLGGIVGYYLPDIIEEAAVLLLPFAVSNFIYIAGSDLIPEIKHGENMGKNLLHFFVFVIGILLMLGLSRLTEGYAT